MSCGEIARGRVLVSSYDGSEVCRCAGESVFQRDGTTMAVERFANFSDEVMGGRRSVGLMEDEEQVERSDWMVNN
jgi:hypothetical protein